MMRLVVILSVFFLIACGGSDTAQTGDAEGAGDTPAVDAAGSSGAGAQADPAAPAAIVDPQVATCLDLVREAKLGEALPVCLAALEVDPDNTEVQAAVEAARAETAKLAAAAAGAEADAAAAAGIADANAAAAAAEAAAGDAASQAGGMADQLGQ